MGSSGGYSYSSSKEWEIVADVVVRTCERRSVEDRGNLVDREPSCQLSTGLLAELCWRLGAISQLSEIGPIKCVCIRWFPC